MCALQGCVCVCARGLLLSKAVHNPSTKPLCEEIPVIIFLQAQAHTLQAAASLPCLFPAGW